MKQSLLFLLVLFAANRLHAQHVTLVPDKMNTVYTGVNTRISVSSDDYTCNQLVVKVNDKELDGKDCEYNFSPGETGMATLTVYGKQGSILKKIDEVPVRVKRLPDPIISLGGKADGYISPGALHASDGIDYKTPTDCNFDLRETISSFTITIYQSSDSELIFHQTYSNGVTKFDEETKRAFYKLRNNDLIVISNIRTQSPDISSRRISDISLRILN